MEKKEWQSLLRRFKEQLAQRLWSLTPLSETEKELFFRDCLSQLADFERDVSSFCETLLSHEKSSAEENDLLRSLLGVPGDELKTRAVSLGRELGSAKTEIESLRENDAALHLKWKQTEQENALLRERIRELEEKSTRGQLEQMKMREEDIRQFSESNQKLKNQLSDLEARLSNLRHLFVEANQKLVTEKQEEISLLQKKLLDEMETALQERQRLLWAEEEMFTKSIAQRVRQTLVAAQGQLLLTLERMGLMDPETKNETQWKARLHLLMEGADNLADSFKDIHRHLEEVTQTLDDYLSLAQHNELKKEALSLKELVARQMAEIYEKRQPTLSVELLSEDPLPTVDADRAMIQFVVDTLLRNALEALPNESGQITISLKKASSRDEVQLAVRDSGSGIPDAIKPRLFQPFFTTKSHRQGLSLSRSKRYAELHGGRLELIDSGPEGTVFQLDLPVNSQAALNLERARAASLLGEKMPSQRG